jgi:hypothetical protein
MKTTFEPGDGSFEITLDKDDKLSSEWIIFGVTVWASGENGFECVKGNHDILKRGSLYLGE